MDCFVASLLAMTEQTYLRRVLQPLQRFENLGLACHRRLALFLFFLDDLFGRVGHEFLVAELGVDPLDVGVGLDDFLVEPGLFGREVDHTLERQRHDLAAHEQLHSAFEAICSAVTALALRGHSASTSRPPRFAVTAQSSSVMKGKNGCSSLRISSRAQAVMARVSAFAAPSSPISTGFASSTYQSQ